MISTMSSAESPGVDRDICGRRRSAKVPGEVLDRLVDGEVRLLDAAGWAHPPPPGAEGALQRADDGGHRVPVIRGGTVHSPAFVGKPSMMLPAMGRAVSVQAR